MAIVRGRQAHCAAIIGRAAVSADDAQFGGQQRYPSPLKKRQMVHAGLETHPTGWRLQTLRMAERY